MGVTILQAPLANRQDMHTGACQAIASYYEPREFANILSYCGFDTTHTRWESGPDCINHVCIAATPAYSNIPLTQTCCTTCLDLVQ
jgi:hypothetical protein